MLENRRRKLTAEAGALFGIDKLNVPRSEIPAVTHVDYSARIQTAPGGTPLYNPLITAFKAQPGCPAVVNTSFNVVLQRARTAGSSTPPRTPSDASLIAR